MISSRMSRSALLCAASAIGLSALAAPAFAQDAQPSNSVSEIVVTAGKREQDLQEVPASVTAFTAEMRDQTGIISAQDQLNFTPGVSYSPAADRVTIRGIGRVTQQLGTDAGVAVYQDGFYVGSATNIGGSTLLTERVEVLRGPQGTLYGRNSVGGAINAITRRPSDDFSGEVRASINSYGGVRAEGRITGPLAEGLSGSLALTGFDQEEGWYKNYANGNDEGGPEESWSLDGQLAYEGENFDAWARYTTLESTAYPRNSSSISRYGLNPDGTPVTQPALLRGTGVPYVFYGLGPDDNPGVTDPRGFRTNRRTTATYDNYHQLIGEFTWHADTFDIKYLGGYRTYDYFYRLDGDASDNSDFLFPYDCAAIFYPGFTSDPAYKALGIDQIEDCDAITPGTQRQYRTVHNDVTRDATDDRTEFSHEINITSTGDGPLQYILGAYYFNSDQRQDFDITSNDEPGNNIIPNGRPNPTTDRSLIYGYRADLETTSKAVFGQVDYQFNEQWKATVGLRYSHDEKIGHEENMFVAWFVTGLPAPFGAGGAFQPFEVVTAICPAPGSPVAGVPPFYRLDPDYACPIARDLKRDWDAVTGTAGVEWTPSEDRLVYLRYSRGYKSGGYNLGTVIENPFVGSEFVNAYELGWKEVLSPELQFNSAAFFYDYIDQQAPASEEQVRGGAQVAVSYLVNLPKVETYGLELETVWSPIENLRIMANYSYLHTEIKDGGPPIGDPADPFAEAPGAKPEGPPTVLNGDIIQQLQSLDGNELPGSPKHKVAINGTYRWELNGAALVASATFNWRDDSYYALFNNPLYAVPGGDSTDLRVSWEHYDSGVTVIGTIENVFDQEVSTGFFTDTPSNLNFQSLYLEPPRIISLEVQYKF